MIAALQPYINTFLDGLAAAGASYVVLILSRVATKVHLSITADQQAQLEVVTKQAIATVAEEAAAKALNKIPTSSLAKLDRAVEIVTAHLPAANPTEATNLVHAILLQVGEGAQVPKAPGV